MSLTEFINMGGYGGYIWTCYGLSILVLVGIGWTARRQLAEARVRALRRVEANREERQ